MGWWETENGNVIGDAPLNELEEHAESLRWQTPDDIPSEAMTAIVEAYREGLGREPGRAELVALLAFHQGDASLGVVAAIACVPRPLDP